jgi:hypothetical protein
VKITPAAKRTAIGPRITLLGWHGGNPSRRRPLRPPSAPALPPPKEELTKLRKPKEGDGGVVFRVVLSLGRHGVQTRARQGEATARLRASMVLDDCVRGLLARRHPAEVAWRAAGMEARCGRAWPWRVPWLLEGAVEVLVPSLPCRVEARGRCGACRPCGAEV